MIFDPAVIFRSGCGHALEGVCAPELSPLQIEPTGAGRASTQPVAPTGWPGDRRPADQAGRSLSDEGPAAVASAGARFVPEGAVTAASTPSGPSPDSGSSANNRSRKP